MNQIKQLKQKINQLIGQTGIYVFFVSLTLFTQIRWIREHNRYNEIEVRLSLAFLIGCSLGFGIVKLVEKIANKFNKARGPLLNDLSIVLSPGILFIFASINNAFLIIGAASCIFSSLYIWVSPFRNFIKSIIYIDKFANILIIKENNAIIEVKGIYEKANPKTMQSFLIDLIVNFYECSEMKIGEIKIDFSSLKQRNEHELKPIMESIARYFNLRITY